LGLRAFFHRRRSRSEDLRSDVRFRKPYGLRSAPGELEPTGTLVVDPDELLAVIGLVHAL
jgi:hypothetical protein